MFTVVSDDDAKKLQWIREYELSLNKKVRVETFLWDCSNGLRPLPTKEECKEWALILGVPDK